MQSFLISLVQVYSRRELLVTLVQRDISIKYKRSIFGLSWSLINPVLTTIVIYLVFNGLFAGRLPNQRGYATYIYTGVLLQMFVISGIPAAANSLSAHWQYITKMRIPPYLFSISASITASIQFSIGLLALLPIWLLTHFSISWRIFLLPLFLFCMIMSLTGIGLMLTGLMIRFDDMNYIIGVVLMILGYLTPIFYTIDALPQRMQDIVQLNPLTQYVNLARYLIIDSSGIEIRELIFVPLFSILIFIFGIRKINQRWNDWVVML
jgi:ABC-2 type transport system permease protein